MATMITNLAIIAQHDKSRPRSWARLGEYLLQRGHHRRAGIPAMAAARQPAQIRRADTALSATRTR
jgi:hypothetical protein